MGAVGRSLWCGGKPSLLSLNGAPKSIHRFSPILMKGAANKITGANAGGPPSLRIGALWAARSAQFHPSARQRRSVMRRIEGTRKEHVLLICMTLAAVAGTFALAAPEKTLTLVAYFGFSAVALLLAVTRLRVLALPALISYFIFAASFLAPVEIAVV